MDGVVCALGRLASGGDCAAADHRPAASVPLPVVSNPECCDIEDHEMEARTREGAPPCNIPVTDSTYAL